MVGTRRHVTTSAGGAALALALALALPLAPGLVGAAGAASSGTRPPVTVDRTIRDGRITESSGLAAGLRQPGLLWTHDDSGHPARLFAVRPDGRTAAVVRVSGVPATDWEAISAYRDASGRPMLAVADIGDNTASRPFVEIVVLPEPPARDATVRPERAIRLQYPTGAVDAEALLVDPDGRRAFVVTKGFGGTVYEVPPDVWRGTATASGAASPAASPAASSAASSAAAAGAPATFVARAGVPLILVTDGVMGPGGHPLLRTYSELAVLPPLDDAVTGGSLQPLAILRLPAQRQGEGLTLRDARTALVGSEGTGEAVLRVPLPPDVLAALTPTATPTPTPTATRATATRATASGATGSPAEPSPGTDDATQDVTAPWFAAVTGGVVALTLVATAVATVRRRRGGGRGSWRR